MTADDAVSSKGICTRITWTLKGGTSVDLLLNLIPGKGHMSIMAKLRVFQTSRKIHADNSQPLCSEEGKWELDRRVFFNFYTFHNSFISPLFLKGEESALICEWEACRAVVLEAITVTLSYPGCFLLHGNTTMDIQILHLFASKGLCWM